MNDFELFTYSVYNALGVGHQNAQTRRELCQKLHCGDRSLRRAIEALRRNYAILSKDDGKGYYLPETSEAGRDEARQWLKRQNDRMHSIKASQPEQPNLQVSTGGSGRMKHLGSSICLAWVGAYERFYKVKPKNFGVGMVFRY